MSIPGSTPILAGLASLLVALFIWFRKPKASTASLPPGPKPVPVLGNIRDLTAKELWLPAAQWAKQYGENRCEVVAPLSHWCLFRRRRVLACPRAGSRILEQSGDCERVVGQAWLNLFR